MDNPIKSLSTLGLCYGYGGLDRGLERGIAALRNAYSGEERCQDRILKYAAHVEIESVAAYNLVAQMEQGVLAPAPVFSDLKKFPWEQFYGKVHIITGGYPCQPFSQAGLQGGVDDPRHLFPHIELGIDAVRPVCCWFENVANHLNIGFEEVRYRLSRLGYKTEAGIFSAEQVGAPHLRKRLFILAVADTYCTEQSKRRGDLREVLGLQEGQCKSEHRPIVSGGDGTSTLADTNLINRRKQQQFKSSEGTRTRNESERSNRELGNPNHEGKQQSVGAVGESGRRNSHTSENVDHSTGEFSEPENEISTRRNSASCSSESMDNSFQSRLEGQRGNGNPKRRWQDTVRSIASSSIFPAGQGSQQFQWEEPRLESRLGFTVNGHDFTEDILRGAGNAVVEQQAELAFRTLIEKFL